MLLGHLNEKLDTLGTTKFIELFEFVIFIFVALILIELAWGT